MKLLAVAFIVLLTGCAQVSTGVNKASDANDAALETALFTVCRGVSVGSIKRRFDTEEKAELWRSLCSEDAFTPVRSD